MKDKIRAWAGNPGWVEIAIGATAAWTIMIILAQLVFRSDGIETIYFIIWGLAAIIVTFLAIRLASVATRALRR